MLALGAESEPLLIALSNENLGVTQGDAARKQAFSSGPAILEIGLCLKTTFQEFQTSHGLKGTFSLDFGEPTH